MNAFGSRNVLPVSRREIVGEWNSAHWAHFESWVSLALLADYVTLATLEMERLFHSEGETIELW